ncbi:hypothetical protein PV327_000539 [Microctonus hyperodae]|uniref:Uncharacterized protein n=1 Tax=Microctonus hyperodae TaxID=165561 RepID=A0AA39L297_MICHY|nr:hypothetical protein PV327_000539 [Microctonus hyperodae]
MSENLLEQSCNSAGDPCTIENPQLNTTTEKLLKLNMAIGEPGIDGQVLILNQQTIEKTSSVNKMTEEIQKQNIECENYKKKLAESEGKLAALQTGDDNYSKVTTKNELSLKCELEEVKKNLTQAELKLQDRDRLIANQENQINALAKQVSSLKEVVAITKSLLEIRNTEVKHLQEDVDSMETKISAERTRHDTMINKMNAAVRLNADLKTEYETQLRLFQDLRGKYQEKVTLLSSENKALEVANASKVE